jgi:hypothetical protein
MWPTRTAMSKGTTKLLYFGAQSGLLGESANRGGTCAGCFDVYGEYRGGAVGSTVQGAQAKGYPINELSQNQIPKVTNETGWNF